MLLVLLLSAMLTGCGASGARTAHVIVFVPGVNGDGPWYDGLKRGLREGVPGASIVTVGWGAPLPLFALNFNTSAIHRDAEEKLARRLVDVRSNGQAATVDVIAHSAGCGVTLGALARLADPSVRVREVILLAPSVSPTFDLSPSLRQIDGRLHVFHSDRDTLYLSWRTSTFGTYDNVKTPAAGNAGFDVARLPDDARARVVQHAYDPGWSQLENDGGHFGWLSRPFVATVLAPAFRAK